MSEENYEEFVNHVKQGAIEVGTDIFEAASGFISDLFSSSESSASSISPSYNYESDGLTVMMSGRQTIILDSDGNSLQKISDNLFRFNDDINLLITDKGVTVLQRSQYGDYSDYAYDLTMDSASPIMVYGLLFTCLISLMILFAIMVKRRRMMIHRRYLLARNSLATAADFAVVDSEVPPTAAQKKNVNDAPPSYETVTEQDKMLPKYEEV